MKAAEATHLNQRGAQAHSRSGDFAEQKSSFLATLPLRSTLSLARTALVLVLSLGRVEGAGGQGKVLRTEGPVGGVPLLLISVGIVFVLNAIVQERLS